MSPVTPEWSQIVDSTAWPELRHAYAHASDTPSRLRELLDEDVRVRGDAVGYLDVAILHQYSVYSATAPAARAIAAMLADPRALRPVEEVLPWDQRTRSLRVALLDFLGRVGESCLLSPEQEAGFERRRPPEELAGLRACRAVVPELFAKVAPFFDDPDEAVGFAALEAGVRFAAHPGLAAARPGLAERLQSFAPRSADPWRRAAFARLIGMLGERPEALLADVHPGVRTAAALAPAFGDDPRALREILTALETPAVVDRWFEPHLPGQEGWFRFDLVRAAVERAVSFEALLPAALAIAPLTSGYTAEHDLMPLLLAAFPTPYEEGAPLSPAQRAYLGALVECDAVWDSPVHGPESCFARAGLPFDRERCRVLAA